MYFNYTLFKLCVYANIFLSHKFGFGEGASYFLEGPVSFWGASKFSNLLAPRATASTSLMSRPGVVELVFVCIDVAVGGCIAGDQLQIAMAVLEGGSE